MRRGMRRQFPKTQSPFSLWQHRMRMNAPRPGIEPGSSACQAEILTTILPRISRSISCHLDKCLQCFARSMDCRSGCCAQPLRELSVSLAPCFGTGFPTPARARSRSFVLRVSGGRSRGDLRRSVVSSSLVGGVARVPLVSARFVLRCVGEQ